MSRPRPRVQVETKPIEITSTQADPRWVRATEILLRAKLRRDAESAATQSAKETTDGTTA